MPNSEYVIVTLSPSEIYLNTLLSIPDVFESFASALHQQDIHNLLLVSRVMREIMMYGLVGPEKLPQKSKRLVCGGDNSTERTVCWGCGILGCAGCLEPRSIGPSSLSTGTWIKGSDTDSKKLICRQCLETPVMEVCVRRGKREYAVAAAGKKLSDDPWVKREISVTSYIRRWRARGWSTMGNVPGDGAGGLVPGIAQGGYLSDLSV